MAVTDPQKAKLLANTIKNNFIENNRMQDNYDQDDEVVTSAVNTFLSSLLLKLNLSCLMKLLTSLKILALKRPPVCELHFSDDAIRRYTEAYNEKTGKKIYVPLKRYRLQNFAVLTIFTNFPAYLSNSGNPTRECPEKRLQRLENEHLQRSIQASIISKEEFEKKEIIYVVSRISRVFKCRGASGPMDGHL
ncbi:hypothetical protein TNCV_2583031 [Trichonephila clavipes]|nr:hypothetical protein TNCV_2583031 [Trichonephila clavipes]